MTELFTKISDPAVVAIPIVECGEPLTDLREQNVIPFGPPPERIDNVCYTKMRTSVYEKLCAAQNLLPKGMRLCLYEAWRSLELQQELFEMMYANNRKTYLDMDHQALFLETTKLVSPVTLLDGTRNIPPHSTGAAIDVYLIDSRGNILDMGLPTDAWSSDTGALLSQTDSLLISEEARHHRSIMNKALEEAGFANYPYEYWHFSYGDRYWAYCKQVPHALYDSVKVKEK